jgi:hypothetical protein
LPKAGWKGLRICFAAFTRHRDHTFCVLPVNSFQQPHRPRLCGVAVNLDVVEVAQPAPCGHDVQVPVSPFSVVNLRRDARALRPLAGGVVAQVFDAQLGVDAEPGGLLGADTTQR